MLLFGVSDVIPIDEPIILSMKQMRTKQFGMILLGLSLALVTSCSKEEVEEPVDNSEPVVPMTSQELTGEFEGEWSSEVGNLQNGKIVVNDGYIFIDEIPAEGIFNEIRQDVLSSCIDYPELKARITDSIGNIFFASSYKYPVTDLQIKYRINSFSSDEGYYSASIKSIKNIWSVTSTVLESTVIDPPEPNTISFTVKVDTLFYRIDLISKEHEVNAEFFMGNGMWLFQYWFNTFRIINMMTGQQYDMAIMNYGYPRRHNKEDTNLLQFQAEERTGSAEERIVPYI